MTTKVSPDKSTRHSATEPVEVNVWATPTTPGRWRIIRSTRHGTHYTQRVCHYGDQLTGELAHGLIRLLNSDPVDRP